jgi:hypothetical protein
MMMRCLLLAAALAACRAAAAPKEVWLTPERRAQLKAITSRPYVTAREDLGNGTERLQWRNGSREWATTQAVRRVAGAKARNPHAEARREAAEAKAALDALLEDVAALGRKSKVTPSELKAVAEKHADARQKK